jgi:methylated-DNA-[protein]-cysteine S-methyltransferase
MSVDYCRLDSLWGPLLLLSDGQYLTGLFFADENHCPPIYSGWRENPGGFPLKTAIDQLRRYFDGDLKKFELPILLHGTDFQVKVWQTLSNIPYGQTKSYSEVATLIERPRSIRAVGQANGRNPISIIIPCHRVIGADGSLTGYGGGLERKRAILEFEASHLAP